MTLERTFTGQPVEPAQLVDVVAMTPDQLKELTIDIYDRYQGALMGFDRRHEGEVLWDSKLLPVKYHGEKDLHSAPTWRIQLMGTGTEELDCRVGVIHDSNVAYVGYKKRNDEEAITLSYAFNPADNNIRVNRVTQGEKRTIDNYTIYEERGIVYVRFDDPAVTATFRAEQLKQEDFPELTNDLAAIYALPAMLSGEQPLPPGWGRSRIRFLSKLRRHVWQLITKQYL